MLVENAIVWQYLNVNTVIDIQIHSLNFTFWPTAGPKSSENRGQIYDPYGHPYKVACI